GELLDLDEVLRTTARELSLGQRMRADLAMALLTEPEILLLDEPTLGLDVLARRRILEFIRELNRERGVTVIVTSHDMAELEQLAGRIVLLHRGEIAFDGAFSELRRHLTGERLLSLETAVNAAPTLAGARLVPGGGGAQESAKDGATGGWRGYWGGAPAQPGVLVEKPPPPPIDDVVADLYDPGLNSPPPTGRGPGGGRGVG